jgi:catechol 2,3-dioxygenase-like lactoylglutathione lyase family enzyme
MDVSIQTVLLNVADLEKSIEFYRGIFDFAVVSQRKRAAALIVKEHDRRQIVVLREVGPSPLHSGRGTIGPRLLAFEVSSPEELELIEQRLEQRHALLRHQRTETYEAVLGVDPDRIEISVASSLRVPRLATRIGRPSTACSQSNETTPPWACGDHACTPRGPYARREDQSYDPAKENCWLAKPSSSAT